MADIATEEPKENVVPNSKLGSKQDNAPKLNGLDTDESMTIDVSVNGNTEDHPDEREDMEAEFSENDVAGHHTNGDADTMADKSLKTSESQSNVINNEDSAEEKSDEKPNGSVNEDGNSTPTEENSAESMEIGSKDDDDSNIVEVSSNVSAPSQDVIEVDPNSSRNPSLISEETSIDSLDSNASVKSKESTVSNLKDNLVSTVKVDDGDEILITLNDDEEVDIKEDETESSTTDKKLESDESLKEVITLNEDENGDDKKDDTESATTDKKTVSDESQKEDQGKKVEVVAESVKTESSKIIVPVTTTTAASITTAAKAAPLLTQSTVNSILIPTSGVNYPILGSQNVLIPGAPSGLQIVRQGNQFGYITLSGSQRIFVPVTGVQVQGTTNSVIASHLAAGTNQQSSQNTKPQTQTVSLEELRPKSSMETIELMKWEVQNRIADNYNWSVAFHPRKEELSTITTFLQELGSDVVKEQVYKDIIQIQTKKKENGDLKNAEIESLEKMKTVYENTKKKVEHLQLESKECEQCKFRTESSVVLNFHADFPHYDPPWDVSKGWMECSHCNFRTKVAPQFIFHMKDIHNAQAKFMEKAQPFQCSLCPLNAATKNKLEKHQQKCTKHFKLNSNLQPYYHDVNFCMKTCYYKPKKPAPPPPKPTPKPAPTVNTRQQAGHLPVQQPNVSQPNLRPSIAPPRLRPSVLRTPVAPSQVQRPIINVPTRPRLQPPALQRAPIPQQQQRPARPQGKEMAGFEVCELCGGYVKDRQALRIHFYYAHKVEMPQAIFNRPSAPLTCEVCKEHFWTTQGLTKHKTAKRHFAGVPPQSTPGKIVSEQECFMCLKKYPNLFVHFERVHGMTMKDLILVRKCIMCGASTNDYKSLETHLVSAHGVMIRVNDYIVDKNKPLKPSASPIISGGKNVGKINYCVFCQIQFAENIQLTMHCIQIHATCETCGMVVATSKHLSGHSCRKAHINKSCYICGTKVASQEKYAVHLRSHVTPCRVELKNLDDDEIISIKEKIKREYKPAVISLDSDEDSDIEVVETKPGKIKVTLEKDTVETVDLSEESKDNKNAMKIEDDDEKNKDSEVKEISDEMALTRAKEADKTESDKDETTEIKEEGDSELSIDKKGIVEKSDDDELETDTKENATNAAKGNVLNDCENELKSQTAIDDNELLKSDDDSNISSGERKRKRSESDIDEDELLRESDESNCKRLKIENDVDDKKESNIDGQTNDGSDKCEEMVSDDVIKESNSDEPTNDSSDKNEEMVSDDVIKESNSDEQANDIGDKNEEMVNNDDKKEGNSDEQTNDSSDKHKEMVCDDATETIKEEGAS